MSPGDKLKAISKIFYEDGLAKTPGFSGVFYFRCLILKKRDSIFKMLKLIAALKHFTYFLAILRSALMFFKQCNVFILPVIHLLYGFF